uniref:Putative conserved protein with signal anchor n=1 Tax=Xenopsylla cheopis TaxID=163159 RepID=A0A6M2DJV1_XENCH
MYFRNERLQYFLNRWPGRRTFGIYRFLPIFFVAGAVLEFSMIKWQVGETNFYKVYKRNQARKIVATRLSQENA